MLNAAQRQKFYETEAKKTGREIKFRNSGQRRSRTEKERKRGTALLIILGVVWTSENETRGVVLDYRPSASYGCRGEFYPTIFFLPFSGLINFGSRDWEMREWDERGEGGGR